jgi:hypothetical protein
MGRHLLRGSGEKGSDCVGTIAEPRKRHTMEGDSEDSLRESIGIV